VNAPFDSTLNDVFFSYKGTAPGSAIKVKSRCHQARKSTDPWIDYDPKVHGYAPFGLHFATRGYVGLEPDPEHNGDWLRMQDMLRFPDGVDSEWLGHARPVDVRNGNGHGWMESDVVPRKPEDGGNLFHCVLWE